MQATIHHDERRMFAGTISSYSFEKPTVTTSVRVTQPDRVDDETPEIPPNIVLGEN